MNTSHPQDSSLLTPFSSKAAGAAVAQAAQDLRSAAALEVADFADQAHTMKEKALESASHLRDITLDKAKEVGTAALERAQALKAAASERALHFKDAAGEQWTDTREKAKEAHAAAEDYIRAHPTKCVLGALGVGFLIGLIVRR